MRKVCIVALVGVSHFVDVYVMHTGDIFRTAIALYYIGNEGISLLENIGNLGVKLPKKLIDILEQIRDDNSGEGKMMSINIKWIQALPTPLLPKGDPLNG